MSYLSSVRSLTNAAGALLIALAAVPAVATADVISVTLNPATIAGGTGGSSTATVAIAQPAAAGGRVIILASSNTDLAASTQRVVVPEGATTATFTVGTNALYRPYSGLAFNTTITATDARRRHLRVRRAARHGADDSRTVHRRHGEHRCESDVRTDVRRIVWHRPGEGARHSLRLPVPAGGPVLGVPLRPGVHARLRNADREWTRSSGRVLDDAAVPGCGQPGDHRRRDGDRTARCSQPAPARFADQRDRQRQSRRRGRAGRRDVGPVGGDDGSFDVETFETAVPAFLQVRADLSLNPFERFAEDYLAVVPSPGSVPPPGPLAAFSVDATPIVSVQGNPSIGTRDSQRRRAERRRGRVARDQQQRAPKCPPPSPWRPARPRRCSTSRPSASRRRRR